MGDVHTVVQAAKEACSAGATICWADAHEGAGTWLAGIASLAVGGVALIAAMLPVWSAASRSRAAAKAALNAARDSIAKAGENFHGLMPETSALYDIMGDMHAVDGLLEVILARTDEPSLVTKLIKIRVLAQGAANEVNTLLVTHRYPGMDAGAPNASFANYLVDADKVIAAQ